MLYVTSQFVAGEVQGKYAVLESHHRRLRLLGWATRLGQLWWCLPAPLRTIRAFHGPWLRQAFAPNTLLWSLALALGGLNSQAVPYLTSLQASSNSPPDIQAVALGWNASPDPAAAGYFLCWGYASEQCTNRLDVGNVTNTSVAGLSLGVLYWFHVVAYDGTGREAAPSNDIIYQPPVAGRPVEPTSLNLGIIQAEGGGTVAQFSFQGQASAIYDVQATTNFQQWTVIGTTNCSASGVVTLEVLAGTNQPRQFFRLAIR